MPHAVLQCALLQLTDYGILPSSRAVHLSSDLIVLSAMLNAVYWRCV